MDLTAKIGLLSAYYPFQVRINALLMAANIVNRYSTSSLANISFTNMILLQDPIKTQLENMTDFRADTAYTAITDAELTPIVLKIWDQFQTFLIPSPIVVTSPTGVA